MRADWALAAAAVLTLSVPQASVPVEREPMHHVVFENALVRVIDAAVPAGTATLYHTHLRDNVPVAVAGGRIATTVVGGDPVESVVALGRVTYARGGYTHEVRNIGTTEVRFIDVELAGPRGRPTGASGLCYTDHHLAIDNERVRVHRLVLVPGQAADGHRHRGPVLEVVIRGDRVARGAATAAAAAAGTFAWRDDGLVPAMRNDGQTDFELVEIEWKPKRE